MTETVVVCTVGITILTLRYLFMNSLACRSPGKIHIDRAQEEIALLNVLLEETTPAGWSRVPFEQRARWLGVRDAWETDDAHEERVKYRARRLAELREVYGLPKTDQE